MIGRIVGSIWKSLLVASIVMMTTIVLLGVAARYILNAPLLWTDEAARVALVWMMFVGIAELFRIRHGHVAIGIMAKLPFPWIVKIVQVLANLVVIATLLAMIAGGLILANPSRPASSAALSIPMWILYAVVPASGIISIALILLRPLSRGQPDSSE